MRSAAWAGGHLLQWHWRASHSRLEPFKKLARMLRARLDGILVWTELRVSNILASSTGQTWYAHWGAPGDVPVPGRYFGGRQDTVAVWRVR